MTPLFLILKKLNFTPDLIKNYFDLIKTLYFRGPNLAPNFSVLDNTN